VDPLFFAIGGAFTVVAPDGERHDFQSEYAPSDLGPATRLLWKTVSDLRVDGRGNLTLDFDDGSELLIPTDGDYEAWRLTGKGWRTLASPPGGGVPKWPVKETGVAGTPDESPSRPEITVHAKLQPPLPTPLDERCTCADAPPVKLMSMRQIDGFNPIHCLKCNLEVEPGRLALPTDLIEEKAVALPAYCDRRGTFSAETSSTGCETRFGKGIGRGTPAGGHCRWVRGGL
jgi:Family of unknown function (DUF6188)